MILKKRIMRYGLTILAILVIAILLFPIYWMMISSIKTRSTFYSHPPELLPTEISFRNYQSILRSKMFITYFGNSTFISLASTAITLILAILGGYGLARFKFKGRNFLSRSLILLYVFPPFLLVIPLYILEANFGLVNTHIGLILTYVAINLPFTLWLLKGFFSSIPVDLEESAMIDGCSRLEAFLKVIVPLSVPGIFAGAIFVFLSTWSEYLFAMVWLNEEYLKTMTIAFRGGSSGRLFAYSTLMCLPIFVFSWFIQKYVVKGITAGAIKG